jgi:hypothetical protein
MGSEVLDTNNVDVYTKAYWPFEEGSGSTAYDQTAYDYDMSVNTAVWSGSGKFGKALDFEHDSDSYLYDSSVGRGETWEEFTIEAWVRQESFAVGYNHYIVSGETPFTFHVYIDPQGYVTLWFYNRNDNGNSQTVQFTSVSRIGINEWKHIAATINVTSGEARIYIDGNLDTTQSFDGSNGLYNDQCCGFYIGAYVWDWSGQNFDGKVDQEGLDHVGIHSGFIFSF